MNSPQLSITSVWQKVTPEDHRDIIRFWTQNQLLPANVSPEDRVREVVLCVRTASGEIVGLSSASLIQFRQLNNNYFFLFRSAILPQYRQPGLVFKLAVDTRDLLESFAKEMTEYRAIGMLTFVENPNLKQKMNQAVWPATGMVYIGDDRDGRQIRVYYFKGATIS